MKCGTVCGIVVRKCILAAAASKAIPRFMKYVPRLTSSYFVSLRLLVIIGASAAAYLGIRSREPFNIIERGIPNGGRDLDSFPAANDKDRSFEKLLPFTHVKTFHGAYKWGIQGFKDVYNL